MDNGELIEVDSNLKLLNKLGDIRNNIILDGYIININIIIKYLFSLPQVKWDINNYFGPGIYIREMVMPGDSLAIGHYHKVPHMNTLVKGKVLLVNDDGSVVKLEAPCTFVGKPGRKIIYFVEDSVWQNIYATEETDLEKIEEMCIDKDMSYSPDKELNESIDIVYQEI